MSDSELLDELLDADADTVIADPEVRERFETAIRQLAAVDPDTPPDDGDRDDDAGGQLQGQVVDADTGDPLSQAIIENTSAEELILFEADADGFFSIPVPEEEVSYRVVATSYEETELTLEPGTRSIEPVGLQRVSVSAADIEAEYQNLAEGDDTLPDERPEERRFPPDQLNTATVRDADLGVEAEITAEGGVPALVEFERDDRTYFDAETVSSAAASDVVAFRSETPLEAARLTVEYESAAVPNDETSLSLHRFDPAFQTFVSVDSTVDTTAQTVTADIETNGVFAVLDPDQWETELESDAPRPLDADGTVRSDEPASNRLTTQ